MRFCSAGGVAAARIGLFYGVWLGGVFSLFRNHVASLRQQTQMAEEDERLAQVKESPASEIPVGLEAARRIPSMVPEGK